MNFSENTGLLIKALRFSADKHRYQRRKDQAQSPYINHPIEVAQLLWDVGGVREINVLLAALLHDTIEDTETRPEEIRKQFGDEVLSLVLEVTDDKNLPKAERKRLQVENAPHKSKGAKLIKLADKCCNVRDLAGSPPKDWSMERKREYLLWTEQVVNGLRGTNPGLEKYYESELTSGKMLLRIR
ncbi:MAG TPA: HD domain-containing protein [Anaerolineales bacterium]|nr:HD domain-containing protein [Anaerolineales bacterium]